MKIQCDELLQDSRAQPHQTTADLQTITPDSTGMKAKYAQLRDIVG
jgi:hypothetical protein